MAPILLTQKYLTCLASLAEPVEVLEKQAFTVQHLTEEELRGKARCSGCGKTMAQLTRKVRKQPLGSVPLPDPTVAARVLVSQPYVPPHVVDEDDTQAASLQKEPPLPPLRCRYHLGNYIGGVWTCCNKPATAQPCGGSYEHSPHGQTLHDLAGLYQCYITPLDPPKRSDWRDAVALDCEMGTAVSGDSELIRITLIDYFTEEVLVDNLVEPDVSMSHLNTRYSGVSWSDMKKARRNGTILRGKAGARHMIWRYVGPGTLVVGHGLNNDLRSLRWIHLNVVDSYVTEFGRTKLKEAEEAAKKSAEEAIKKADEENKGTITRGVSDNAEILKKMTLDAGTNSSTLEAEKPKVARVRKPGNHSLKTLAMKYLNRDIQNKGNKGHDSLEDAIAARDVVHWNVVQVQGAWLPQDHPELVAKGFNELSAKGYLH